ncbi:MAG: 2Fe-2S iron-sulfur cluster-binding protein, partial [Candidatus Omnitrophica bacterium]|nr:2Fe-2S iron-sulfur cluster-binding protein [Candidatus Omnitrophota bacterium]
MQKYKVTFLPDNKTVEAQRGKDILSLAISAGIYIDSSCGGKGTCGKCRIILKKGKVLTQSTGRLTPQDKKRNVYLACLTSVESDLEVEIPEESRLDPEKFSPEKLELKLRNMYSHSEETVFFLEEILEEKDFKHSPLTKKLYLELSPPTLEDRLSDLERLYRQIRQVYNIPVIETGLVNIRRLSHLLRQADWKVTVTLGKNNSITEVILIEPKDTSQKNFGVCFDIGTTTITAELIDLNSRKILSTKASYNKQAVFGSDI